MIPYGRQTLDERDKKAVLEVLKTDYLTTGPKVNEFEKKVCDYVGSTYGVAVNVRSLSLTRVLRGGVSPLNTHTDVSAAEARDDTTASTFSHRRSRRTTRHHRSSLEKHRNAT